MNPTFTAYLNSNISPFRHYMESCETDSKGLLEDVIKSVGVVLSSAMSGKLVLGTKTTRPL